MTEMESEGIFDLRSMLGKDLNDGTSIATALRGQIIQAASAGDYGTEQMMKEILLGHENYVHHLEHFLGSESLTQHLIKA